MMRRIAILAVGLAGLVFIACDNTCYEPVDYEPPAVPRGLISVTGDGEVILEWYPNQERDLAGYHVWYSRSADGTYERIASTTAARYVDRDVENGVTYYYAVSAYDFDGNESKLSREIVHDTPRPEGYDVKLWAYKDRPNKAGFHFSSRGDVVPYDSDDADMYFDYDVETGVGYMIVPVTNPLTEIQDYGYVGHDADSLRRINWAPEDGWSPSGVVELIEGHGYVVWTWDNYFGAFVVTRVRDGYVLFDWSYQTDRGNPELKVVPALPSDLAKK